MKKLVFWISFSIVVGSCSHRRNSSTAAVEKNTQKVQMQDTVDAVISAPIGDSSAVKKRKKSRVKEAPKHNAPDQHEIDSIKATKAKLKHS